MVLALIYLLANTLLGDGTKLFSQEYELRQVIHSFDLILTTGCHNFITTVLVFDFSNLSCTKQQHHSLISHLRSIYYVGILLVQRI